MSNLLLISGTDEASNNPLLDVNQYVRLIRDSSEEVLRRLRGRFPNVSFSDREDAWGDALERLWVTRDQYDPEKMPRVEDWIYMLARNALLDILVRRKKSGVIYADESQLTAIWNKVAPVSRDEDSLSELAPHLRECFNSLMAALSRSDRELLWAWSRDRDSGEWAESFARDHGITSGASRVRLCRLRRRIAEQLHLREQLVRNTQDSENNDG